MLSKIKKAFRNPKLIALYLMGHRASRVIPDKIFLKMKFYFEMGYSLNLDYPKTFNEKLQWLKLYDRKSQYTRMVDKLAVREYIREVIGEKYLIPLLGAYESYKQIDVDSLPDRFVLKPNHTSGDVFICRDKTKIDHVKLENMVDAWLKREYYWVGREWPYVHIKPAILCEKYIADESGVELKDYKFMCFHGEPKIIQVMSGRKQGHYFLNHFDVNWDRLNIPRKTCKENPEGIKRPHNLGKMIAISRKLSRHIPFVRIDLYNTPSGIFFGEITFYPVSGFMDFVYKQDDYMLGDWIELPVAKG